MSGIGKNPSELGHVKTDEGVVDGVGVEVDIVVELVVDLLVVEVVVVVLGGPPERTTQLSWQWIKLVH